MYWEGDLDPCLPGAVPYCEGIVEPGAVPYWEGGVDPRCTPPPAPRVPYVPEGGVEPLIPNSKIIVKHDIFNKTEWNFIFIGITWNIRI